MLTESLVQQCPFFKVCVHGEEDVKEISRRKGVCRYSLRSFAFEEQSTQYSEASLLQACEIYQSFLASFTHSLSLSGRYPYIRFLHSVFRVDYSFEGINEIYRKRERVFINIQTVLCQHLQWCLYCYSYYFRKRFCTQFFIMILFARFSSMWVRETTATTIIS